MMRIFIIQIHDPVIHLEVDEDVIVFTRKICAVFSTSLTDRASTIPSNIRGGCQSGTWSAGQKKMRRNIYKVLTRAKNKTKNDKTKGTIITKYTC